jgi:hypothetical protein
MTNVLRQLLPTLLAEQREDLIALFTEAILEEREACAQVVEDTQYLNLSESTKIAAEIRARR